MLLDFYVNEKRVCLEVAPDERLVDILRERLGLCGTKEGCGEGECGACTVLLENKAVHACLCLACQLEGQHVTTVEGLCKDGVLDPLQRAFIECGAIQCGYCTPGMLMAAKGLLLENPHPTEAEIRRAISGNICRCSGYTEIVQAIQTAASGPEEETL